MDSYICPLCDGRFAFVGTGNQPVTCTTCESTYGRVVECVRHSELPVENAFATPTDAAIAREATTPTVASGFYEGLPPMPMATQAERPARWRFPWISASAVGLIFAVLGCLLITTVQRVRDAASRTRSTNNLKILGLAAHGFHDANKRLPFNGTKPAVGGDNTSGSWAFMLLPYLDEKAMYDNVDRTRGLPVLLCPGRGRPVMCAYDGGPGAWSDYCLNPFLNSNIGQADARDKGRTMMGITDGSSNTIFAGHGRLRAAYYGMAKTDYGFTASIFIGGSEGTCRGNPNVVMAPDANDAKPGEWGGPFSQGCLMAMCDGTVRMFPYTLVGGQIDYGGRAYPFPAVAGFLTPNGGETSAPCGDKNGD
ncbi:MAG: DUF1559 domain-containing protein [Gemmataceae bacterium]|nr:DUF1559 domain-containing protein [Gemmataceae bacterium]